MPAETGFQSGNRCGYGEMCCTWFCRSTAYALSMSLTMIATCWKERSLLRASVGTGAPVAPMNCSNSMLSSPSFRSTARTRAFGVAPLFECQHVPIEIDRAVHVCHSHHHGPDLERVSLCGEQGGQHWSKQQKQPNPPDCASTKHAQPPPNRARPWHPSVRECGHPPATHSP